MRNLDAHVFSVRLRAGRCVALLYWLLPPSLGLALTPAQEEAAPIAPFKLTDWGGEVGFWVDYASETQKHADAQTIQYSNLSFEEYLDYELAGYLYHPRLVDFRARFKTGLLQQTIDQQGQTFDNRAVGGSNTAVYGYDVNVQLLKRHPVSGFLLANRDRDAVRELFTDRVMLETENYGGGVNLKAGPFSMDVSYRESRVNEIGFESRSDSISRMFEYRVRNTLMDRVRSELRYRRQDYEQNFEAHGPLVSVDRQTNLQSNDVTFDNTIDLTRDRTSYLSSNVRQYDQTGTQEFSTQSWQERLNLRHSKSLDTYYMFSLLRSQLEDSDILTKRAEIGLNHRLYESLLTHVDAHWRQSDFAEVSDTQRGVTGNVNYRKTTPWGLLTAGYGRTVDQIERGGESSDRIVIDEALTMVDGVTQFLANPDVDAGSIVVTDQAGHNTFVKGFDYDVETRGNRTGLRLLLGGLLKDGDIVLVDYHYHVTGGIDYTSVDQTFNARYDFERYVRGLSLYYLWHDLDASGFDAGRDDLSILIYTDNLYGASWDWDWLTWTEEYETYRSNFSNYNQLRSELEGRYRLPWSTQWSWSLGKLNVDYLDEDLGDEARYSDILYAGSTLHGRFLSNGFWELETRARKEKGLIDETLYGLLGRFGVNFRKMRVEAGARVEQRDRFDSQRDRMNLFLQVARKLQ
ncbi:MAG: hypothetical protein NTW86_21630 [Candidatus Sumerlaeota bacterium]|nr:hypothetical protein [Candidatus Sumerlaeota bacterium]